jgi:hypothetical protein
MTLRVKESPCDGAADWTPGRLKGFRKELHRGHTWKEKKHGVRFFSFAALRRTPRPG